MREGWTYKKLGDVTKITMGQSPCSDTYNDSDGLPFFQGNADFGKEHPTVRVFCNAPIRIAEPNDILISVRAPIGAINIADRKCCIGRGLAALRGNENTLNRFVYYFLFASKEILITKGTGAIFKSIGKDAISSLYIPIPPLPEQERIVAELDLLTEIINKQKAQLKELDNLAQSIFYDMFGDPVENEKGWEVKELEQISETGSGGTPSKTVNEFWEGGIIPWIGSNMCQNKIIYETDGKYITQLGLNKSSAKLLPSDTVLVALVGATIGKVGLLKIECCTNQNIAFVKPSNKINCYFLFYTIMNLYCLFMDIGNGKFRMANLFFIKHLLIILPPLALQQQFAAKIEHIEKQKEAITRSIAEAQQLFNYTMDKYFG